MGTAQVTFVVVVLPEVIACAYATGSDVCGHDRKWRHRNYVLRMRNRFQRFSSYHSNTVRSLMHFTIFSSDYIAWNTLQYRDSEKTPQKRITGFQNIIGFFIITLWVLRRRWWWWWRRRHVRGLISTWLFWGPVGHHNLRKVCYWKWRHWKLRWPCNYGHLSFQLRLS